MCFTPSAGKTLLCISMLHHSRFYSQNNWQHSEHLQTSSMGFEIKWTVHYINEEWLTCDLCSYSSRKRFNMPNVPIWTKVHSNITWPKWKIHFSLLYLQQMHKNYLKKKHFFKLKFTSKTNKIFLRIYWSCEAWKLFPFKPPQWFLNPDDDTL